MSKIGLRVVWLYFFFQAVPLDWKFYRQLAHIDWLHLHYGDIFTIAHYSPTWLGPVQGFGDWGILLGLAIVGALLWTYKDRNVVRAERYYDNLYYWIRTIARYRLAIGIIAYGFIKLFPLQAPFPSLSNLNTNYGDFTRWKLFSLSLGIVPNYESFLGLVEIVGGLLLFYRKTASIGAFIILVFLGNVFMSNLAYEGGDTVYSLYLISLGLLVLSYDLGRLADLLVFQRRAKPSRFRPEVAKGLRLGLKGVLFFFFVVVYGWKTGNGWKHDPYQFPTAAGLEGAAGLYNVELYKIGKDTLQYSKTDPVRWQDVVFEPWATLSIRSNRTVLLDSNNQERPELQGNARTYELEGTAGRHYYSYEIDAGHQALVLHNKNPHYDNEVFRLHYERPDSGRIVLSGAASGQDSIYVVLHRVEKKYLLEEAALKGRQAAMKL